MSENQPKHLMLMFTIGPVQSFIEAARKTEDLWMGSYILSYLIATAMEKIQGDDIEIIYPAIGNQSPFDFWGKQDPTTPSFPNLFLAISDGIRDSQGDLAKRAKKAEQSVKTEFESIAKRVLDKAFGNWHGTYVENIFNRQISDFFDIYWVITEEETDQKYGDWYAHTAGSLAAVKNCRTFEQTEEVGRKCSLDGTREILHPKEEESIEDAMKWWERFAKRTPRHCRQKEALCAVSLTKRMGMHFLENYSKFSTEFAESRPRFPSTSEVATANYKEQIVCKPDALEAYTKYCEAVKNLRQSNVHEREEIHSIAPVLTAIAEKPRATLLGIISELLKREPTLVPIVETYTDGVVASEFGDTPTPSASTVVASATTTTYREQIDRLFGDRFLEQHQLHKVIAQLTELVGHAESLARAGATEFALSILSALIHQSIVRYEDTLQGPELPRFVGTCTTQFVQIADALQEAAALREYRRPLLELSFEAEAAFTPHLINLLKPLCATQDTTELQTAIEQRLDESRDRQTHVQLLLYLYLNSDQIAASFRLARREEAAADFINLLFERQDEDTIWEALEEFPLTIENYWDVLKNSFAKRIPNFTEQLLTFVERHRPETAIMLYQELIEQVLTSRKRTDYKTVQHYLTEAQKLYQHLDQDSEWQAYLKALRERYRRKRTLLEMLASPLFTNR